MDLYLLLQFLIMGATAYWLSKVALWALTRPTQPMKQD